MYNEQDPAGHEASDPTVPDSEVSDLIEAETERLLEGIVEDIDEYSVPLANPDTGETEQTTYRNGYIHTEFLSPEGERVAISRDTNQDGTTTVIKTWQLAEGGVHGPYAVYRITDLENFAGGKIGFKTVAYYYGGEIYKDGQRFDTTQGDSDPDLRAAMAELQGIKKGGGNTGIHQSEFNAIKGSLAALKPEYRRVFHGIEINFDDLNGLE